MYRRPGFSPYQLVTSTRTQNTWFFWFLTAALDATKIYSARPSIDLYAPSLAANLGVRVGWQISDNALAWPSSVSATPTTIFATNTLASQNTEGVVYGAVWEDIHAAMTAQFARFGVWVTNPTNANLEMVMAAIRVETKPT